MVPKPSPVKVKFRLLVDGRLGNPWYIKFKTKYESLSKLPSALVWDGWTVFFDFPNVHLDYVNRLNFKYGKGINNKRQNFIFVFQQTYFNIVGP